MVTTTQLNIKNRTYYFYDDLINLKDFDSNLLKLDKKSSRNISIYYIGYVTKKTEYNINSVNPLYLLISELDGFIEEKEGSKYLNIYLTFNNNDVLVKFAEIWRGIKDQIKKINKGSVGEYAEDYMKIKFDSDDDLSLNKILKFRDICHYWCFLDKNFSYQPHLCNGCHDLMQKAMSFNDVAIVSIKGSDYRIHFWYMSKDDAISIMHNSNLIDKKGTL